MLPWQQHTRCVTQALWPCINSNHAGGQDQVCVQLPHWYLLTQHCTFTYMLCGVTDGIRDTWILTQHTFKYKDRLDFYPCIADALLDASDCTCHRFIAEIVCMIYIQNPPQHMVMQPFASILWTKLILNSMYTSTVVWEDPNSKWFNYSQKALYTDL